MIDGEPFDLVPFRLFLFFSGPFYLAHGCINHWFDKEKVSAICLSC